MSRSDETRQHSTYKEKTTALAQYGYTVLRAQVLENWLANAVFMTQLLDGQASWREKDRHMEAAYAATMGQLFARLRTLVPLPPGLEESVKDSLALRNSLVHGFFRTRTELINTRLGYLQLVKELEEAQGQLDNTTDLLRGTISDLGRTLGFAPEQIAKVGADFIDYFNGLPTEKRERMLAEFQELG